MKNKATGKKVLEAVPNAKKVSKGIRHSLQDALGSHKPIRFPLRSKPKSVLLHKVVFNTDAVEEFLLQKNNEFKRFVTDNISPDNITTTAVNEAELLLAPRHHLRYKKLRKWLTPYNVFPITEECSLVFSKLVKAYRNCNGLTLEDLLTASVCIANEIPLFTFETCRFSAIKNLKIVQHSFKSSKAVKGPL